MFYAVQFESKTYQTTDFKMFLIGNSNQRRLEAFPTRNSLHENLFKQSQKASPEPLEMWTAGQINKSNSALNLHFFLSSEKQINILRFCGNLLKQQPSCNIYEIFTRAQAEGPEATERSKYVFIWCQMRWRAGPFQSRVILKAHAATREDSMPFLVRILIRTMDVRWFNSSGSGQLLKAWHSPLDSDNLATPFGPGRGLIGPPTTLPSRSNLVPSTNNYFLVTVSVSVSLSTWFCLIDSVWLAYRKPYVSIYYNLFKADGCFFSLSVSAWKMP